MGRVEESDEERYPNAFALYERACENAKRGKRGQALLREMEAALLALPEKRLIRTYMCREGQVCGLGAVAVERRMRQGKTREQARLELEREAEGWHDEEDNQGVEFAMNEIGLARTLAVDIMFHNDLYGSHDETPERKYERMLEWVRSQIRQPAEQQGNT